MKAESEEYVKDERKIKMYNQSFTTKEVFSIAHYDERMFLLKTFGNEEKVFQQLTNAVDGFINNYTGLAFRNIDGVYVNGQAKGSIEFCAQDLVLRKLYNNIKNVYYVKQSNRNKIVRQITTMLEEGYPLWILRLDVKSFYESISRDKLINRFCDDCRLSGDSMTILKLVFENPVIKASQGLPRGLSISSAMSEMYMRYFDVKVQSHTNTYYYARFVDDIIVFCNNKKGKDLVLKMIKEELSVLELTLNEQKTMDLSDEAFARGASLVYLGYEFNVQQRSHSHKVTISIAPEKIKKIETRLVKSFAGFIKDHDYALLRDRIRFLTGNYVVRNLNDLVPIRAGIYYNYSQLTEKEDDKALKELNRFYRSMLFSNSPRFGQKIKTLMTASQKQELNSYSFTFGFSHKVSHYFSPARMEQIKWCWL